MVGSMYDVCTTYSNLSNEVYLTAKEAIKLKREEEELSGLAGMYYNMFLHISFLYFILCICCSSLYFAKAEVARRHTMANFYPSIAFIFLYRILASEQSGKLVAILPFQPFNFLQKVTFRGLSTVMTAQELNILWLQSKGLDATKILSLDVSNVSQACAFAFIYILCTLSIKKIVNDIFGVRAPEGAGGGVDTMLDSPQNQKILSSFGVDANEMKEARKAGKGLGLL